jgi:RNA polymerase sigma-70 factor (ECF subfamily)
LRDGESDRLFFVTSAIVRFTSGSASGRRRRVRPPHLVLERLGPVERAAFLLHEVFDYGYDEIARIVSKSEANCRQLVARARQRVRTDRPRYEATPQQSEALAARFFASIGLGDLDGLVRLLAEDIVVYGDGGGKAPQWPRPVAGAIAVARLFVGLGRQISTLVSSSNVAR